MNDADKSPPESGLKRKSPKKNVGYYTGLKTTYEEFIKGNKFLTIPEALNTVNTRTTSLLTTDVNSWKLIGVSRETMDEALRTVNVAPRVLARRSNAMWGILLLASEEEAKKQAGNILVTKAARLQTVGPL